MRALAQSYRALKDLNVKLNSLRASVAENNNKHIKMFYTNNKYSLKKIINETDHVTR